MSILWLPRHRALFLRAACDLRPNVEQKFDGPCRAASALIPWCRWGPT